MHPRLVAWLLERLYNECAAFYTTVAMWISHGHWFLWGETVIPLLTAPVLELGCGTGQLQRALATRGITAYGIDRSAAMLRRAPKGLALVRADATRLPCATSSLATVVAVFPTPYIADPQTIAEIDRVLTPDGQLVVLLSAGAHDVTAHPLWSAYTENGWTLARPQFSSAGRPLHIIVAARMPRGRGASDAAHH